MKPRYFKTSAEFRAWLDEHHATEQAVLVGFFRIGSGKPSLTWPEAVDQALCYGWIDGVRQRVDAERYTNRFTPRRPRSNWSKINIDKVIALRKAGLMMPAGERAFAAREAKRSGVYSFEQEQPQELSPEFQKRFKLKKKAWNYYLSQPPYYRRVTAFWVMSARKDETRVKRLTTLIEDSAAGRRVGVIPQSR